MQEITKEIWRPIRGYENLYEVSNLGKVRSLDKLVRRGTGVMLMKRKVLKPYIDRYGYLLVTLYKDGKRTTFSVHRLVAMAFQDVCCQFRSGLEVDHINTSKTDNRAVNLRWCTRKENNNNPLTKQHYSDANKGKFGKLNPNSKPIIQYDRQGKFIAEFEGTHDAARKLGIHQGNISACCTGKLKSAGGFKWAYKQ